MIGYVSNVSCKLQFDLTSTTRCMIVYSSSITPLSSSHNKSGVARRYYYEVEVLELAAGTASTISLGFVWAPF